MVDPMDQARQSSRGIRANQYSKVEAPSKEMEKVVA